MTEATREVVVGERRDGSSRYRQEIEVGTHRLVADEPASAGGTDAGPAPYEYLLSALGACTAMTLRMYAEMKHLPLTRVSVALTHEKVPVDGSRKIDRIERRITLEGELTPAQRQRLLEIANRCPVHRSLSGEIRIDSSLAADH